MKFNQLSKKEQEIRNYLLADAFTGFVGIGLHASVVNTTPQKMPSADSNKTLEKALDLMSISFRKVFITDSYTSHIVGIS
ncbi:hypothetical protein [Aquimarina litoralis]|uniref:hypothetical protein n=1 Tax=Aquimarina litoralis TaxID=584605 RepID=UPI001C562889|nr:hypothetical protein [Aquimarina litoralis]MBW1297861.1 hypothetical protein [Aquimarina litoralis]